MIGAVQADACGSVTLSFVKSFPYSLVVSLDQAIVPANESLYRNRLRGGKGQIVQRPPFALCAPILSEAIRAVPRPEEFTCLRVQSFAHGFELLPRHITTQPEQFCCPAMPFTLYAAVLVVVVAVFEMPLSIPGTARHGSYGQHIPTLTLFEFRMQGVLQFFPFADKSPGGIL